MDSRNKVVQPLLIFQNGGLVQLWITLKKKHILECTLGKLTIASGIFTKNIPINRV